VFDAFVVSIGCLVLFRVPMGPLMLVRNVRAFRIFRLFNRVPSLRKITNSIANAVPGVANAFLIMVIFMCIYAILAVEFFNLHGKGGSMRIYPEADWGVNVSVVEESVELKTLRGHDYGEEYFGTFSRALYTLFQVLTGDSWSEAVARPIIFGFSPSPRFERHVGSAGSVFAAFFYVSFIVITQVILINVVVAVLLEKMVTDDDDDEEDDEDEGGEAPSVVPPAADAAATPFLEPQAQLPQRESEERRLSRESHPPHEAHHHHHQPLWAKKLATDVTHLREEMMHMRAAMERLIALQQLQQQAAGESAVSA